MFSQEMEQKVKAVFGRMVKSVPGHPAMLSISNWLVFTSHGCDKCHHGWKTRVSCLLMYHGKQSYRSAGLVSGVGSKALEG